MRAIGRVVLMGAALATCGAMPASASAVVPSPYKIPATKVAAGKGAHFQLKRGNRLSITLDNGRAGNKLRRQFNGQMVYVECYGIDAANTTALDQIGYVRWRKGAGKLVVSLQRKIVPAVCKVGLTLSKGPSGFFGIYDLLTDPTPPGDAFHAAQFAPLEAVVNRSYDALVRLDGKGVVNPSPQQLIDEMATDTSYTPPLPLTALTSDLQFVDATLIGLWSDDDELRANQTLADGSTVAWVMMPVAIS